MATAQARLAGRFPPGTDVRLVEVSSAAALRAEGGREVDSQTVGDDGVVTFSKGVEVGRRYFVVGLVGGAAARAASGAGGHAAAFGHAARDGPPGRPLRSGAAAPAGGCAEGHAADVGHEAA
jgi:hypothetical protein